MRMALGALGPGFKPWQKISVIDSDFRRTGDDTSRAVVYKLYSADERLSENAVYIRQMPDGTVKKAYGYQSLIEELLDEPHPTKTVEYRGRKVPVARYELHWSALELYTPRSAEQLAALRVSREQKKAERERSATCFPSLALRACESVPCPGNKSRFWHRRTTHSQSPAARVFLCGVVRRRQSKPRRSGGEVANSLFLTV
jgi:hypothetical protein